MTDTLKPYPEYKDSGLPWVGRIPAHWRLATLRRVADIQLSNVDKHTIQGEQPVRLCNYTDVYYHRYITPDMDFMKATALPREVEKFELRQGDVVVTKDSEDWKDIAVPALVIDNLPGVLCGYHLAHIRPDQAQLYGGYLMWACRSEPVAMQFRVAATGVTRYAVSGPDIKGSVLPLPPIDEQDAIGRYLRENEKKVNRFIRNRRRLIEVLNEQKQAIINRAVTRGLDPDVKLKPSGVDWLGDIPEHWDVWKIGHFARVGNGSTPSRGNMAYWSHGDYPWLNSSSVNQGTITESNQFVTALALEECHLPRVEPDSVVIAITGQGKTRGTAAVLRMEATINQHIAYITSRTRRVSVNPEFLRAFLATAYPELRRMSDDSGSTKGALTCGDLRQFQVVIPPAQEQDAIVASIKEDTQEVEAALRTAEREIDLIREYRTRLIADVVTGKVDVRHLAPPPGSEDLEETIHELEPLDDAAGELEDEALAGEVPHAD